MPGGRSSPENDETETPADSEETLAIKRQEELELLMLTLETIATLLQGANNSTDHSSVRLSAH